jgi:hypothetical protein
MVKCSLAGGKTVAISESVYPKAKEECNPPLPPDEFDPLIS